jgi:NADH:ubiquinone oxidoreductase subunit 3 (subunit A)
LLELTLLIAGLITGLLVLNFILTAKKIKRTKITSFERGFRAAGRHTRGYNNAFISIVVVFLLFETEVRVLLL